MAKKSLKGVGILLIFPVMVGIGGILTVFYGSEILGKYLIECFTRKEAR